MFSSENCRYVIDYIVTNVQSLMQLFASVKQGSARKKPDGSETQAKMDNIFIHTGIQLFHTSILLC